MCAILQFKIRLISDKRKIYDNLWHITSMFETVCHQWTSETNRIFTTVCDIVHPCLKYIVHPCLKLSVINGLWIRVILSPYWKRITPTNWLPSDGTDVAVVYSRLREEWGNDAFVRIIFLYTNLVMRGAEIEVLGVTVRRMSVSNVRYANDIALCVE